MKNLGSNPKERGGEDGRETREAMGGGGGGVGGVFFTCKMYERKHKRGWDGLVDLFYISNINDEC